MKETDVSTPHYAICRIIGLDALNGLSKCTLVYRIIDLALRQWYVLVITLARTIPRFRGGTCEVFVDVRNSKARLCLIPSIITYTGNHIHHATRHTEQKDPRRMFPGLCKDKDQY